MNRASNTSKEKDLIFFSSFNDKIGDSISVN